MTTMERPGAAGAGGTAATGERGTVQRTEGEGSAPTHMHPATVHEHGHFHVSHHHKDGMFNEWEHRTYWHTHEHNHAGLTHSHDYSLQEEEAAHAQEAHVHD